MEDEVVLDEDGMTRPVWNQRSLSCEPEYTLNFLPGIPLTHAFLVSNPVLDRLSVRCGLFEMQGSWIGCNASARRDPRGTVRLSFTLG